MPFQLMYFFFKFSENEATQTTKQYVQRKVIIKNADGSTKVINQTVAVAPQPQPVHQAQKPEQKVQIIRNPDGKITVRGLAPGQQLIQTADGKLHVVNTNPVQPKPAVQTTSTQQHAKTIIAAKPNVIAKPVIKPVNYPIVLVILMMFKIIFFIIGSRIPQ